MATEQVLQDQGLLRKILLFVPGKAFRFSAAVNKSFYRAYLATHNQSRKTSIQRALQAVATARVWTAEQLTQFPFTFMPCDKAAEYGTLEVLQALRRQGCDWSTNTCSWAASRRKLDMLIWAREHGCDWDARTCHEAARHGHLDVLIWAREHGCDWDARTCDYAAQNGHLDILISAREHGCDWDEETCSTSAQAQGHLDIVEWIRQHP